METMANGIKHESVAGKADATSKKRIVISGMAGLYPEAHNVRELADILYSKKNPVTKEKCRYKFNHPESTEWVGVVPGLELFDAQFFRVHYHLSLAMDPMSRKVLEQVYLAIYDAGICPESLSGKKVGVFCGLSSSETEKSYLYKETSSTGLGIVGSSKAMYANRISYWLNAKGPSFTVDAACCGSMVALGIALNAIERGECDAAIVTGSRIYIHPQTLVNVSRSVKMSTDGKTRSFDEDASGCAFSEAITVLFLQKAEDALRIYADVKHVKCEYDMMLKEDSGPRFGLVRETSALAKFMSRFYDEVNISPKDVAYVEAFGSAVPESDKAELEAIDKVFCEKRSKPLRVGSVTSNIGYTDSASGIASITKVLLGYHTGRLAANLHLDKLRKDIPCLNDGRIQLLKEHHPFLEGYAAVNGFSLSGINAHVLLHNQYKPKDLSRYKTDIPYLVTISGRQESSVKKIIDDLTAHPLDPEQIALLHNVHESNVTSHMGRGFAILGTNNKNETVCLSEKVHYFDDVKRPLWFVYSGMGSQWAGMGAHLLRIPTFAAAIEKCHRVLEPKGVYIVDIITSTDKSTFNNILNSFVGIAAVQIGLTDVLHELGLVPDKYIGHSVGELGCAYADRCFTAEEMILAAYYRGMVSLETTLIRGSMAAVGLGYKQVINICPADIQVACHNSADSCTISGPAASIKAFAEKLTSEGIFIREVNCSNIAYHSRYIADAGPALLKYLRELLKTPKPRSQRWVSTSVPMEKWNTPEALYSSAEYHTNNLLNPVLFEESSRHIPPNAVLVEIAPHGLLQAILNRALPNTCVNIALTNRGNGSLVYFLESIGKIYMQGYTPKIAALYPKIEFPVSTGTPMLSHLVEWAHGETWLWPGYVAADTREASACKFLISIHDEEHSYLQGHILREKNLYPFAAVLMDVWDTISMIHRIQPRVLPVQFRDVRFFVQPTLHERRQVALSVTVQRVAGRFEKVADLHGRPSSFGVAAHRTIDKNGLEASMMSTSPHLTSMVDNVLQYLNCYLWDIYHELPLLQVMDDVTKVATGYVDINFNEDSTGLKMLDENTEEFDVTSNDLYDMAFNRDYCYRDDFRSIHSATNSFNDARILWRNNWVTYLDGILQLTALKRFHETVSQPEYIRKLQINVAENNNKIMKIGKEEVVVAKVFGEANCIRCGGVSIQNIEYRDLPPLKRGFISLEVYKNEKMLPNKSINENDETVQKNDSSGYHLQLKRVSDGLSDELQWVRTAYGNSQGIDVTVYYAGLTSKDIQRNMVYGDQKLENAFGADFSGTLHDGQRIMGLVENGAASSRLKARKEMLWPVPEHWSLEDAATVPYVYCLAYYCLAERLQLEPGMRIFVENGISPFGQAVISIAVSKNCEVFTSVSNTSEQRYLLKMFPQLQEDHVCSSNSDKFAEMILTKTDGKGCQFIISRPKGALMEDVLKCAGEFGVTIITDYGPECHLGMYYLFKSRTVFFLNDYLLFLKDNEKVLQRLQKLVANGITSGAVRPLPRISYSPQQATSAMHRLSGNNYGRVLLNLRDDMPSAKMRFTCTLEELHVIVCANEAMGLMLAEKLVLLGNRKLHIHSQNPLKYAHVKLRSWLKQDIEVHTSYGDLSKEITARLLINNCKQLAPVEGIHIIMLEKLQTQPADKIRLTIENLDLVSRKLCPHLKYFTVLSEDGMGLKTLISRQQHKLPATMLNIFNLMKINAQNVLSGPGIKRWEAVNTLEEAVMSNQPVVCAVKHVGPKHSILAEVAKLTDLNVSNEVDPKTTLAELGLNVKKASTVSSYLQDVYNISYYEQEILALTVSRLQEIEEILLQSEFEETQGLDTFFSYVEPDELVGTMDMTFPVTLISTNMGKIEIATKEQHFLIVPGMEGFQARFTQLCARLKLPALVLQPGVDHPGEPVEQLASRYVKIILKNMQLNGHFYLVGYETGVMVALEMVSILEKHGLTGTVFCIGGGPQTISSAVNEVLNSFGSEEALQEALLRHMMRVMTSNNLDTRALDEAFREGLPWKSKVETCVRLLLGSASNSAQYTRSIIETAYARLLQARSYVAKPRAFKSSIIALYPAHSSSLDLTELQKFSQEPVKVYQLRATLGNATSDLRCAAILNQNLAPELLQEFKMKNRCETYTVSGDAVTVLK